MCSLSQVNINVVELFNKTKEPVSFQWDARTFVVPGGGSIHCLEAAAQHGVKHSMYLLNTITGEYETKLGIRGISSEEPGPLDPGGELVNRKAIEEVEGKATVTRIANPIKIEPKPAVSRGVLFEEAPDNIPDRNMVNDVKSDK